MPERKPTTIVSQQPGTAPGPAAPKPKPGKPQAKPKAKPAAEPQPEERPVIYPAYRTEVATLADVEDGTNKVPPIDADRAKELLGWLQQPEGEDWGDDYLLTDNNGKKIRCTNNDHNRPFTESWSRTLAQEVLKIHFAPKGPNGENVVIGRTGRVLSAQHRLIAVALAQQIYDGPEKPHWEEIRKWPDGKVYIETFVAYGVDETQETTRTLDNVRPRSLGDVLFGEGVFGKKVTKAEERALCSMTDYAVRTVWDRTGAADAFSPYRTHSESLEFIKHHPYLLECVRHIHTEAAGVKQFGKKYATPGTAAGLMYLMAASNADKDKYHDFKWPHKEADADMSAADKAAEFWVLLCKGSPTFAPLREAMAELVDPDTDETASRAEKLAVLIKAWNLFHAGKALTKDALQLEYEKDSDGVWHLLSKPLVCDGATGIDLGPDGGAKKESRTGDGGEAAVEQRKAAAKARKDGTPPPVAAVSDDIKDQLADLKKKHPGRVLLFRTESGQLFAYEDDAERVAKCCDLKVITHHGTKRVAFFKSALDGYLGKMAAARFQVAIAEKGKDGSWLVADAATSASPPPPEPAANGTPAPAAKKPTPGKPPVKKPQPLRGGTN